MAKIGINPAISVLAETAKSPNMRRKAAELREFAGRSHFYKTPPNCVEARPRIELGCKDLQSSASPLRHRASRMFAFANAALERLPNGLDRVMQLPIGLSKKIV
jgi:hypothetical protein